MMNGFTDPRWFTRLGPGYVREVFCLNVGLQVENEMELCDFVRLKYLHECFFLL